MTLPRSIILFVLCAFWVAPVRAEVDADLNAEIVRVQLVQAQRDRTHVPAVENPAGTPDGLTTSPMSCADVRVSAPGASREAPADLATERGREADVAFLIRKVM